MEAADYAAVHRKHGHSQFSCPLWSFPKRKTTRHGLKGLHARCGCATVHIHLLRCSSCCCGAHHASRSAPTSHNRLNAVETRSKKLAKTRSLDQFWPMPIGVNKARGDKTKEVDALWIHCT